MPWIKTKNASYVGKWYKVLYNLQGTEVLEAYENLFPGQDFDPKAHYEILNDEANRGLLVVLYKKRNLTIEELAETMGLKIDDIRARIEFFRVNGIKQVGIRESYGSTGG